MDVGFSPLMAKSCFSKFSVNPRPGVVPHQHQPSPPRMQRGARGDALAAQAGAPALGRATSQRNSPSGCRLPLREPDRALSVCHYRIVQSWHCWAGAAQISLEIGATAARGSVDAGVGLALPGAGCHFPVRLSASARGDQTLQHLHREMLEFRQKYLSFLGSTIRLSF